MDMNDMMEYCTEMMGSGMMVCLITLTN
jgi:hypothetical protein